MPIRISAEEGVVSFPAINCSNPMVVSYFASLPDSVRESALERALAIGVMAMRDDRISAFLAKTESELGLHLESLKRMFDSSTLSLKSAPVKGVAGELAMVDALTTFVEGRNLKDSIQLIGNVSGALKRNKTGDILCTLDPDDDESPQIVIECKLDKSVRLGDPASDGMTNGRSDTAWSQLVEARANRGTDVAIMVFSADSTDRTIGAFTDSVRYIKGVGFIALVDLPRGDFRPLSIAYELAREHALSRQIESINADQIDMLMRKMCADLNSALKIKEFLRTAMANCEQAMAQVDVAWAQAEATRIALLELLKTGRLENSQLLKLLVPHKS
jgi:hypothetical protein